MWLDEYSEDLRDPPQGHAALHLLLDHLGVSGAVSGHARCQPNFCSLAGQAEALLRGFQRDGRATSTASWCWEGVWLRVVYCIVCWLRVV